MRVYLALGDSISIDDYAGVRRGGAASQLARKLDAELVDLTRDGNLTEGVVADLARAPAAADVVTITAGGNDLLGGDQPRAILRRLQTIARRIQPLEARVVINTIYDPSDGDNDLGRRELGLSRLATIELRRLNAANRGITELADQHGFLLADLEWLSTDTARISGAVVRPGDRAEPRRRDRDRRALAYPAGSIRGNCRQRMQRSFDKDDRELPGSLRADSRPRMRAARDLVAEGGTRGCLQRRR